MIPIKFKKSCEIKGELYEKGDSFDVNKENIKLLWKLNERGFIESITLKEYKQIEKELNEKNFKKEDVKVKG